MHGLNLKMGHVRYHFSSKIQNFDMCFFGQNAEEDTMLVRLSKDTTSMESNLEIALKIKHEFTL